MGKKRGRVTASYANDKYEIRVTLELYMWQEDGFWFVYSPALDLTGYGESEIAANDSFKVMLNETVKYMDNKGTTYDELERLGWMVNRRKKKVTSPEFEELLRDNDQLQSLVNNPDVQRKNEKVALSL